MFELASTPPYQLLEGKLQAILRTPVRRRRSARGRQAAVDQFRVQLQADPAFGQPALKELEEYLTQSSTLPWTSRATLEFVALKVNEQVLIGVFEDTTGLQVGEQVKLVCSFIPGKIRLFRPTQKHRQGPVQIVQAILREQDQWLWLPYLLPRSTFVVPIVLFMLYIGMTLYNQSERWQLSLFLSMLALVELFRQGHTPGNPNHVFNLRRGSHLPQMLTLLGLPIPERWNPSLHRLPRRRPDGTRNPVAYDFRAAIQAQKQRYLQVVAQA
ncbi:hypothetical protein [Leeia sp.]|uniref:hypothetical protein n=1 Tax=Leeia sp. TaxID=2884678 RepID=UPI0035B4AFED